VGLSLSEPRIIPMPRKRSRKKSPKKKIFSAATEVRRQARELQGTPPPTRVIPNKRHKPPKHKKKLEEEQ
jgi:hypothetical protein